MPDSRLRNTEVKILKANWDFCTAEEDSGDVVCVPLTRGQIRMISAIIGYQKWPTRWYGNVPDAPVLTDFVDAIHAALEIECMAITDIRITDCVLEVTEDGENWIPVGDLSSCAPPSPIQDLRDDNCQLQYHDGSTWQDVPNANYMPTDARCDFTDTVGIVTDDITEQAYIQATNDREGTDAAKTATRIEAYLRDSAGIKLGGMIRHAWDSVSSSRVELTFSTLIGNVFRQVLSLSENARAMTLNIWRDNGITDGLRIEDQSSAWSGSDAIAYRQQNRYVMRYGGTGLMRLYRRNTSANAAIDNLTLSSFNGVTTPVNGYGSMIGFQAQDDTSEDQNVGQIQAVWANVSHLARSGEIRLRPYDVSGVSTALAVARASGQTKIGFHNSSPVAKPTISGTDLIAVVGDLLDQMDAYGLIDDQTGVLTVDGGGEGTIETMDFVTEIYRALEVSDWGMNTSGSGYGEWTSTIGWVPGSNGFRVNKNYDENMQCIAVRVKFETNFTTGQTVGLGFDMTGLTRLLHEEFIGTGQIFHEWNYRVLWRNSTVTGIGLHIADASGYDPSMHGSITWTDLDIAVKGFANQEADGPNYADPLSDPLRYFQYVDIVDNFDGDEWQWQFS